MLQYYEHRQTGKRYVVVSFDTEANTVRLKGTHGELDEPNDPEHFARMNYVLREGDPATDAPLSGGSGAPPPPPAATLTSEKYDASASVAPSAPAAPETPPAPPLPPPASAAAVAPAIPAAPAEPATPAVPPAPSSVPPPPGASVPPPPPPIPGA